MNTDLSSKLAQVIEQIPKDVLYGFLCEYGTQIAQMAQILGHHR